MFTVHSRTLITVSPRKEYIEGECLSTDTKPTDDTIYNGSRIIEMDSATIYHWDDENKKWESFE